MLNKGYKGQECSLNTSGFFSLHIVTNQATARIAWRTKGGDSASQRRHHKGWPPTQPTNKAALSIIIR